MNEQHKTATSQRLDRTLEIGIVIGRLAAATALVLNAKGVRGRVRHPRRLLVGVGAVATHALVTATDALRPGRGVTRARAVGDVLAECVAIMTEALAWGGRYTTPDPILGASYAAVVDAWLPFQLADRDLAIALGAVAATFAASTTSRYALDPHVRVRGQRFGAAITLSQGAVAGRSFVGVLRRQTAALDAARQEVLEQEARVASERERQHQFRVLHDSALQILEAIAGGWDVDDAILLQRLTFEIERLEQSLHGELLESRSDLGVVLHAIGDEFASEGLRTRLIVEPGLTGPPEVIDALAAAAREALRNVQKHARVGQATLAARWENGLRVEVTDRGRGFDMADDHGHGFGLRESVSARMQDVGGTASVESRVGSGTVVRLWVPTESAQS